MSLYILSLPYDSRRYNTLYYNNMYMYVYIYIYTYVIIIYMLYICVYVHIYIYICLAHKQMNTHVCIYIYTHIHIHTYDTYVRRRLDLLLLGGHRRRGHHTPRDRMLFCLNEFMLSCCHLFVIVV